MEISGKAELLALELVEFIEDKFNESGVELPVALVWLMSAVVY